MSLLNALARMEELKQQGRQRGVQQLNDFFKNRTDQNRRKRMSKLGQKLLAQKDKSPQALEKFAQANDLKLSEMAELVQMVTGFQQYAAMQTQRQREGEMWNRGTTEWKQGQSDRDRIAGIRAETDPNDPGSVRSAMVGGAVSGPAGNSILRSLEPREPQKIWVHNPKTKANAEISAVQWPEYAKQGWKQGKRSSYSSTGQKNISGKDAWAFEQQSFEEIMGNLGYFKNPNPLKGDDIWLKNEDSTPAPPDVVRRAKSAARQKVGTAYDLIKNNQVANFYEADRFLSDRARKMAGPDVESSPAPEKPEQAQPAGGGKSIPLAIPKYRQGVQSYNETSQRLNQEKPGIGERVLDFLKRTGGPTAPRPAQPQQNSPVAVPAGRGLHPNPKTWKVRKVGKQYIADIGNGKTVALSPQQVNAWLATQQQQQTQEPIYNLGPTSVQKPVLNRMIDSLP